MSDYNLVSELIVTILWFKVKIDGWHFCWSLWKNSTAGCGDEPCLHEEDFSDTQVEWISRRLCVIENMASTIWQPLTLSTCQVLVVERLYCIKNRLFIKSYSLGSQDSEKWETLLLHITDYIRHGSALHAALLAHTAPILLFVLLICVSGFIFWIPLLRMLIKVFILFYSIYIIFVLTIKLRLEAQWWIPLVL